MRDAEPEVVAASRSPNGNLDALVEADERCAYFYLRPDPDAELDESMKAVWVRNFVRAPARLRHEDMEAGLPPVMPAAMCRHPEGAPRFRDGGLRVVWFEEGDAAALLENDEILAILPSWAGRDGFHGYARDCAAESPLAWPLPDGEIVERVHAADAFWRSFEDGDPVTPVHDAGLAAIEKTFGEPTHLYRIGDPPFPPRLLARCARGESVVLVTCGMQLQPMPSVERYVEDPGPWRRVELGLAVERTVFERAPDAIQRWLAGQSSYPWSRHTWFGPGHTMPCDAMPPSSRGTAYEAVIFSTAPSGAPPLRFPKLRGDPVNVLWMLPITTKERALAEKQGSQAVAARLAFVHRDR